ncbi:Hypothetical protein CINCED_3A024147 [Cinara cedri]|uniref:Uncharacterized protein n=1 Tax=Cinara cedri TaxID=506608 RepID=A0A5E4MXA7_9HEMI|nr:Hypothetical protein CINCED_3A024147 [Cinara cedri]
MQCSICKIANNSVSNPKCEKSLTANLTVRKKYVETKSVENVSLDSLADINNGISSVLIKIKELTSVVDVVETLVTFCSNKIDAFDAKLESLNLKIISFDKRLVVLDEKYNKLQLEIDNLNSNANILLFSH